MGYSPKSLGFLSRKIPGILKVTKFPENQEKCKIVQEIKKIVKNKKCRKYITLKAVSLMLREIRNPKGFLDCFDPAIQIRPKTGSPLVSQMSAVFPRKSIIGR